MSGPYASGPRAGEPVLPERYWCELAWLGGESADAGVLLTVEDGRFTAVERAPALPPDALHLRGLTLPGLANAHSHAFQRALRGRTQNTTGTFWTWREQMYALAATLDPDRYRALARATFAEMALAGITLVGEFHYLHHGPGGVPYADPNEMGHVILHAAAEAGVRLTLLDTCYLQGGIDEPLLPAQARFRDAGADGWCARVDELRATPAARIGAAIHSVRAVDPPAARVVAEWARERDAPLHAHVSEQTAENEQCAAAYANTPTGVLHSEGALETTFTAVHATHLTAADIELLGRAGATCCLCPTTERDLADGIGPARALREAGAWLALGSDSHAVIDPFEEARALELDERLATGERGRHTPGALLSAATDGGYVSLGWPEGGRLAAGALADFTTVALDGVRLAGTDPRHAIPATVFAATAERRARRLRRRALDRARRAPRRLRRGRGAGGGDRGRRLVSTLTLDNIGLLVTNDPVLGEGPLGLRHDVALVLDTWHGVLAIEPAGVSADQRLDVGGRCVIPGFVDSHTHLVFAGDRAEEFAARMAGAPYQAGGIQTSVAATRAATDDELRALAASRRREALRAGITHLEIKSGYALDVEGEARLCALAAELTDDVTYLGAHVVAPEYAGRADDYVRLVCGPMLDACRGRARWVDVFCEEGAFDVEQSRAVLAAGREAGLGLRVHANQLRAGDGVRLAVEMGAASADHCTHLLDADLEALAGSDTVATFLPLTDFCTRQPYPDARRAIDAGVSVALATNTNPGSSYSTAMNLVLALAVRDMGMTLEEALAAATLGGARALRRDDVGRLAPGDRADAVVLDAPSPAHLVYRPGVPLVAATVLGGTIAWRDDERLPTASSPGRA